MFSSTLGPRPVLPLSLATWLPSPPAQPKELGRGLHSAGAGALHPAQNMALAASSCWLTLAASVGTQIFSCQSPDSALGPGIGVSDTQRPKVQTNATLEGFYILLGMLPPCSVFQEDLVALAKQSDLPVRKVETWFRHQWAQDHPRLMKKFCEVLGSYWLSLVLQPLPPILGWLYLLELSFYCSLMATLPFDLKRKGLVNVCVTFAARSTEEAQAIEELLH
uniref:Uncharacterized protein n=1 Tax=Serinus canaria TaxID=9135 RepID=A0A8C9MEY4_SERCA